MSKGCTALIAAAALLMSGAAGAQSVSVLSGAVAGKVISASTAIAANSTSVVFSTPSEGHFVLRTACGLRHRTNLRGSTFGFIALIRVDDALTCVNFDPGVALPQNEDLVCENENANPGACHITGVLQTRP
jgi:hypothetical protein